MKKRYAILFTVLVIFILGAGLIIGNVYSPYIGNCSIAAVLGWNTTRIYNFFLKGG